MRSTDNGSSWDNASSGITTTIEDVTFGNNTFVAVGDSGNIVRSTDNGSSFSNVVDPGTHLTGVGFGNNTFVVVGVYGELHRSTDNGTNWESKKSVNPVGTSERLNSVAF